LTYIRGLAVLMMEKLDFCLRGKSRVEPKMYDQESLDPYWITKLDGGQIGISRDGTIKAYDFSRGTYGAMVRESRASWLLRWIQ
jgi:hypothetical protein